MGGSGLASGGQDVGFPEGVAARSVSLRLSVHLGSCALALVGLVPSWPVSWLLDAAGVGSVFPADGHAATPLSHPDVCLQLSVVCLPPHPVT